MMIDSYLRNQASPIAHNIPLSHENSNIMRKNLHADDSRQNSSFQDVNHNKRKVNKQRPASANSAGRLKGFTFRDFQDKNKFIKNEVFSTYHLKFVTSLL